MATDAVPADAPRYDEEGDSLLPGEVPTTDRLDDAAHWEAVYAELTGFLDGAELGLPAARLERLRGRLAFWRRMREELGGHRPPPGRALPEAPPP